jgi:hypothetical protein
MLPPYYSPRNPHLDERHDDALMFCSNLCDSCNNEICVCEELKTFIAGMPQHVFEKPKPIRKGKRSVKPPAYVDNTSFQLKTSVVPPSRGKHLLLTISHRSDSTVLSRAKVAIGFLGSGPDIAAEMQLVKDTLWLSYSFDGEEYGVPSN